MKPTLPQLRQLVGNPNAYAVQRTDGSWYPVREALDDAVLREHLAGRKTVGTYVLDKDKARTLVLDVDDEPDSLAVAEQLVDALHTLGIPRSMVGVEFSGRKGHHVWVVLQQFVDARELRRIGRAACALAGVTTR